MLRSYDPWIIQILPNSYFCIAPHRPALTILLDFFFLSILPLCPLGAPVSWQIVLYPQLLYQMFLLPPCSNLYSPLLFLNHYSFSVSDNCSFEAYAVSLHLSFINISSCVNFSLWFVSHLPGSGRKKMDIWQEKCWGRAWSTTWRAEFDQTWERWIEGVGRMCEPHKILK